MILAGVLCGSQQSTRSLTTDGAAFVIYVSRETTENGFGRTMHIQNLPDIIEFSPDVVSGTGPHRKQFCIDASASPIAAGRT
eukprot:scaffold75064_cov55-Attheya_sp.AAC.3